MSIKIDTKKLLGSVTLAADIALKNTQRYHSFAGMINIHVYHRVLRIEAYGGTASITVDINRSDGYEYEGMWNACIKAKELISAVKSFLFSEALEICIKDDALKLSPASDMYDYIKIPIQPYHLQRPESPEVYDQELTVDREYFIKGLKQVEHLPATEEKMLNYMCVSFESTNNTLKFIAGSGGCFGVIEYVGNNKVISSEDTRMIFPKTNISNIIRIFKKASCSTLDIKLSSGNPTENIPQQQIIETDDITVRIYGSEAFIRYPDVNRVTKHDYTYQIPTKVQDWKYVVEAIIASSHSFNGNIYNMKIITDLLHGHFEMQTNAQLHINRKVSFELETCVFDAGKNKNYKPWFCCNAYYLIEMVKKNKKKKIVIINFEDQAKLDGLSGKEKGERAKPVILKFPDEIDKNSVTEKSLVFFIVSDGWDDEDWRPEQESIESRAEILDIR